MDRTSKIFGNEMPVKVVNKAIKSKKKNQKKQKSPVLMNKSVRLKIKNRLNTKTTRLLRLHQRPMTKSTDKRNLTLLMM